VTPSPIIVSPKFPRSHGRIATILDVRALMCLGKGKDDSFMLRRVRQYEKLGLIDKSDTPDWRDGLAKTL
jgi:hypothetical protein